jgi:heme oxygenase (biliverdin-IX-beta and delta-forming)
MAGHGRLPPLPGWYDGVSCAVGGRARWSRLAGWRPLAITGALRLDLRDLDLDFAEMEPEVGRRSGPTCAAEAIGIAYVLEGSNLGAFVLSRRASRIGFSDGHGARHLARQRGGLDNWRRFLSIVESLDALDMDQAGEAAVSAFEAASTAFARA